MTENTILPLACLAWGNSDAFSTARTRQSMLFQKGSGSAPPETHKMNGRFYPIRPFHNVYIGKHPQSFLAPGQLASCVECSSPSAGAGEESTSLRNPIMEVVENEFGSIFVRDGRDRRFQSSSTPLTECVLSDGFRQPLLSLPIRPFFSAYGVAIAVHGASALDYSKLVYYNRCC